MKNVVPVITDVKSVSNNELIVTFANGIIKRFNVQPYIDEFDVFKLISDYAYFKNVYVDSFGYAIAWNDSIDIDRYDIWKFGKVV